MNLTDDLARPFFTGEIQAHTFRFLEAEYQAQEKRCAEALNLTPRDRWAHLELIREGFDLSDDGEFWPGALACSWPDPVPNSALEVRARLSVGEA